MVEVVTQGSPKKLPCGHDINPRLAKIVKAQVGDEALRAVAGGDHRARLHLLHLRMFGNSFELRVGGLFGDPTSNHPIPCPKPPVLFVPFWRLCMENQKALKLSTPTSDPLPKSQETRTLQSSLRLSTARKIPP